MSCNNPLAQRARFKNMVEFSNTLPTPHVIVDLQLIKSYYERMKKACPYATIYFALKACPLNEIATMLYGMGSCFDIASRYELDQVLALGVSPARVFYGNPIKKEEDVAYFWSKGVTTFASDSENDVRKIARVAPGAQVYFRMLLPASNSADWPLSRKFGCHSDMVLHLINLALSLGLKPVGLSFHVGSQQRDVTVWDTALGLCADIFAKSPCKLSLIDMGGGLPARYVYETMSLENYGLIINGYIEKHFPDAKIRPRFVMEPGRSLVADSGILASTVVEVARKGGDEDYRWVFLDTGKFNGMIETIDESIRYSSVCSCDMDCSHPTEPVVLAGPTCDSMDIMYEKEKYPLPVDLKAGDRIYFLAAGAYTASYASVCFNGFPPIKTYVFN